MKSFYEMLQLIEGIEPIDPRSTEDGTRSVLRQYDLGTTKGRNVSNEKLPRGMHEVPPGAVFDYSDVVIKTIDGTGNVLDIRDKYKSINLYVKSEGYGDTALPSIFFTLGEIIDKHYNKYNDIENVTPVFINEVVKATIKFIRKKIKSQINTRNLKVYELHIHCPDFATKEHYDTWGLDADTSKKSFWHQYKLINKINESIQKIGTIDSFFPIDEPVLNSAYKTTTQTFMKPQEPPDWRPDSSVPEDYYAL